MGVSHVCYVASPHITGRCKATIKTLSIATRGWMANHLQQKIFRLAIGRSLLYDTLHTGIDLPERVMGAQAYLKGFCGRALPVRRGSGTMSFLPPLFWGRWDQMIWYQYLQPFPHNLWCFFLLPSTLLLDRLYSSPSHPSIAQRVQGPTLTSVPHYSVTLWHFNALHEIHNW